MEKEQDGFKSESPVSRPNFKCVAWPEVLTRWRFRNLSPFLLAPAERGCGKGPAPSVDGKLAGDLFLEGQGVLHALFNVTKCNSKIAFMCVFSTLHGKFTK